MNQRRSRWLRKLVQTQNPVLLTIIRNKYGERTKEMGSVQIYRAAKKLWNRGFMKEVKGWPTYKQLKKAN